MDVAPLFAPHGPLVKAIKGFEARPQQAQLAQAVADNTGCLMVEAGTGCGKSISYLVPAAMRAHEARTPTIVATATVALQEQLLRDVQILKPLFPRLMAMVLKGRANYACPRRLAARLEGAHKLKGKATVNNMKVRDYKRYLAEVEKMCKANKFDRSEASPDAMQIWNLVDCTECNDLRQCPRCPVREVRERAKFAHIVFVSHHLLMADSAHQMVLPDFDHLIVDEAHRLLDIATTFLSFTLPASPGWLKDLKELKIEFPYYTDYLSLLAQTRLLGVGEPPVIVDNQGLERLRRSHAARLTQQISALADDVPGQSDEAIRATRGLADLAHEIERFFDADDNVRWVQNDTPHFAPLEVGPYLAQKVWGDRKVTLMSATLRLLGKFDYESLGLPKPTEMVLDTVFNYPKQCLLVLPPGPGPDDPGYYQHVAGVAEDLYAALGGAVLVLCTSYAALNAIGAILKKNGIPTLVQGQDGDRLFMLEQFKKGGTVMLGAAIFWEGIDLVGDFLRGLVIARLPFDVPTDPLHKARARLYDDSFTQYTLPRTSLRLRQGFGRLIRSTKDKGVVAICDQRAVDKEYGQWLLADLPPCALYRGNAVGYITTKWLGEAA